MIGRKEDRKLILEIPKDKIADFIFLNLRDMWAVDGLYYLGIEEEIGTDAATEIDRKVWEVMGKIEARKLKKLFDITGDDVASMISALRLSGWTLDLEDKEISVKKDRTILRNVKCRVQNTRIKKGLSEFACKPVRWGFLKSFAREFNPDIEVDCKLCPPDKHPDDLWCEWEFKIKENITT
ncbi:hypothetical protein MBGDN05_00677 [Thermoplasmatales archaeon SCGC AB-539-N05]|nr:hypothetical protein MBGDN05_00677 [Thermoplasmatales archaeon SCGC AB-539-N05]